MYYGPVNLGTTDFALFCQVETDKNPVAADSGALAYRIYGAGSSTPLLTGTFTTTVVNSQTGFYTAAGISLTTGNGFAAGNTYVIRITYAVSTVSQVQIQTVTVV